MATIDAPRLGEFTQAAWQQQMSLAYAQYLAILSEVHVPALAMKQFITRFPASVATPFLRKDLELATKAAVAVGTSTDPAWAGPLAAPSTLEQAFFAIVRSASLLGRISGIRKVPFNTNVPVETTGAAFSWTQEGAPKPASAMSFSNTIKLPPTKADAILVVSEELVKLSAETLPSALRDTFVNEITAFVDKSFLDPASAAVANTRPASVTNGTTPITNTGNLATDVQSLLTAFYTARPNAADAVLVANAGKAAALRTLNSGGGPGLPVLVSDAAVGNIIVAIDPAGIYVADDGVRIDVSTQATIELNDAPAAPTASTIIQSLWQMNLRGFRVERFVNWTAASGAVKYIN